MCCRRLQRQRLSRCEKYSAVSVLTVVQERDGVVENLASFSSRSVTVLHEEYETVNIS
jgi:hypothetical protein